MVTGCIRAGNCLIVLTLCLFWLLTISISAKRQDRAGFLQPYCAEQGFYSQRCPYSGYPYGNSAHNRQIRQFAVAKKKGKSGKSTRGAPSGTLADRQALIDKSAELGIAQEDVEAYLKKFVVVKRKEKKPGVSESGTTSEETGEESTKKKKRKTLPKRLLERKEFLPEKGLEYSLDEAIDRIKLISNVRFTEGIDVALRIPLTKKKIRATAGQYARLITIPHESLKSKRRRIAVFAKPEICEEIRALGCKKVAYLGGAELIDQIKAAQEYPKVDFVLSDLATFHKLSVIGRLLGRKGLMPSLLNGTCIQHTADLIEKIQQVENGNTFLLRADRAGDVKCNFADVTMPKEQIRENLLEIVRYLKQNRPPFAAAQLFSAAYVSSSMGPSFKITLRDIGCRPKTKKRKWY